jgi:hypothetical protein
MRSLKKALAFILTCSLYLISFKAAGNPESLARAEAQIGMLFSRMAASTVDSDKKSINDSIVQLMEVTLQISGSMDFPFTQLTKIGKISTTDAKIRIYTWNLPWNDGTNTYFGFLQYKTNNKGEIKQVFLNDKSDEIPDASKGALSPSQWYGMLIYEIVETKDGGNVYYTLLGLDNHDLFVSCKIADVLYFDDHNDPVFGKQIFHYQNRLLCRVIFQYSAKVKMSLKWNSKMKMIIFDHLAPPSSAYTGNYAYYGPDFSYDGFRFEDGKWELVEKVDVRRE